HGVMQLGGGELVEGVGDVEVGGPPVGTEGGGFGGERIGHTGDGGAVGEPGAGLLDRAGVVLVVEAAAGRMEDDPGGPPAPAREAVVQDISGVLGLDAGHALAVVEDAAGVSL